MVEIALRTRAEVAESPTWLAETGELLWVDIPAAEIHRFSPSTGSDTVRHAPQHVGAARPRANGGLVLNLVDGVGLLDPDGGFRWLADLARDGVRGNDAAVDPQGRLWAGTMRYDQARGGGRLYRVDPDGAVVTVLESVTISNGIGWSPDGTLMYYADTPTGRVDVFDYAPSGELSGRREFAAIDGGSPDGLTVDGDGCVWVAVWGGGQVRRYAPDGRLDRAVDVPVDRPTACAFGGRGLTDLYITSESKEGQPLAGSLFVLPGAGVGLPERLFAG
ncbi:SMP-30/gluconolactonase/LRE family protein [Microtetraspora niveoalba]|uniref:SMP-30/gluconolactonase/LRE family protein n=1 Tax=Microtetraspora niveoalba TaxID=46175 RepID=UPI00082C0D66|nr:SMP-30/gluconolactonase/LRE family protein [Microtetraspora niveoalba]